MNRSQSERQLNLERLQTDLAHLEDAYRATLRQFNCSLSDTCRPKLETELAALDRQITTIEIEIKSASLDEGMGYGGEILNIAKRHDRQDGIAPLDN